MGLPQLCNTCQIPMAFTEPDDPTAICFRALEHNGEKYHFCSDGCRDIFAFEPDKYVQSWLPVHEIFKGNCGGADLKDVLAWYHLVGGTDNMEYIGSAEQTNWDQWMAQRTKTSG